MRRTSHIRLLAAQRRRRPLPVFLVTALLLGVPAGAAQGAAAPTRLQVFATSSLTDAFEDLAAAFTQRHPTIDVVLTFAGSQTLRLQIEQGAEADVFASADERHMLALVELGDVTTSVVFAGNDLVVITPLDDPAGIATFTDLPRATRLVIANENVPVGAYTRTMLERAGERFGEAFAQSVLRRVVSEESNVRLVRAKVELGEADAAIVYRTEALASSAVRSLPIDDDVNVVAGYSLGRVERTRRGAAADLFIDFVLSAEGQALLAARGFRPAP
jgi:molybdate transport system substrate-binding protein